MHPQGFDAAGLSFIYVDGVDKDHDEVDPVDDADVDSYVDDGDEEEK